MGALTGPSAARILLCALDEMAAIAAPPRTPTLPRQVLFVVVLLLSFGAFLTLRPFWVPLVLAAWFALLVRPLHDRVGRRLRGKHHAAALATVMLVLAALTPLAVIVLSLAGDAAALIERVLASGSTPEAIKALANGEVTDIVSGEPHRWMELAQRHGASALQVAGKIAGATVALVVAVVVFVMGFYVFLIDGPRIYHWLEARAPVRTLHFRALAAAFAETGRGLIVGVGLTALLQGTVAAGGYLAVGVPHALVLGLLTAFAALIPSIGSGLVWIPVTIALALGGRTGAALAILIIGIVVSLVDNVVRPFLSRYGRLRMPTFLLFIAMLGGITAFGAWGLLLGPLLVRMTMEGWNLLRERRGATFGEPPPPEPGPEPAGAIGAVRAEV